MPKISPAAMESRRLAILEAAKARFLSTGFAGTSVDQICAEAGISKGAFYGHFPTKDAVIGAIAASRSGGFDELRSARSLTDLEARIMAMITPLSAVGKLEIEMWGYCLHNPEYRTGVAKNSEHLLQVLSQVLERLKKEDGIVLTTTPAAAAILLQTFLMGALARAAIDDTPEQEVKKALRELIGAIQK